MDFYATLPVTLKNNFRLQFSANRTVLSCHIAQHKVPKDFTVGQWIINSKTYMCLQNRWELLLSVYLRSFSAVSSHCVTFRMWTLVYFIWEGRATNVHPARSISNILSEEEESKNSLLKAIRLSTRIAFSSCLYVYVSSCHRHVNIVFLVKN